MEKNMNIQKICFFLFVGISVAVFFFTLYFMTDYQDLFGLVGNRYTENKAVASFHDNSMQPANRFFFAFAIVAVLSALFAYMMETKDKFADKFALIVLGTLCVVLIGVAVYNIIQLTSLLAEYRSLDLSYVDDEGGFAHDYTEVAFFVGYAIYALQIAISGLFAGILAKNHFGYLKLNKEVVA